ncbi:hypothetical protein PT282_05055 [Bifidobacterium sp. ESL0763]|uniref:hypothetical protein n=1 Tax=Bifidobacterium sp. ESL0763 TaxID=2983227 RepID=UPI0023F96AF5|nr:hypothetical protein [Bifidobacterium sp. ESL0763]MDF7664030.1 hypothetical protein [Bifidobacterium sp. ESL0763]
MSDGNDHAICVAERLETGCSNKKRAKSHLSSYGITFLINIGENPEVVWIFDEAVGIWKEGCHAREA